jgi:hypothetical protein
LNTEGEEPLTGDADMDAFRDQISYALFYKWSYVCMNVITLDG